MAFWTFKGIRISELFSKFFVGIRISECFVEFFFYGDQNFFIPAWVFLGGIRNYESYNKKVPKELCRKSSLFDGIRKKS